MSLPFEFADGANDDLQEVVGSLAEESVSAALRLADDLESAFNHLGKYPETGHRRRDLIDVDGLRFWSTSGYLIVYFSDRSPIFIVAILHGARDAVAYLKQRLSQL